MNLSFRQLFCWITLPLYVLDQVSKWWIVLTFPEPNYGVRVIELTSWFHIIRVHNQGVAFGMGNGTSWAPIVFFFVPMIALFGIRHFWKKGLFPNKPARYAVALLLAGIFGNFTDRLFQGFQLQSVAAESYWTRLSEGYVVDFISIRLRGFEKIMPKSDGWWPTFNVADSCICIAAALLFISGMVEEKNRKKASQGGGM
jgi:signal peptidase II